MSDIDLNKLLYIPNYYWKNLPWYRRMLLDYLPIKIFLQGFKVVLSEIPVVYSMCREDYMEQLQYLKENSTMSLELCYIAPTFAFSVPKISLRRYSSIHRAFGFNGVWKNLFLWLYLEHLKCLQIDYDVVPRVLITHAEMQPLENYLVQKMNATGVRTISLQHGLYEDYMGVDTVNVTNYLGVSTSYFFSWGRTTKDLILKYNPSCDVRIVGKFVVSDVVQRRGDYFSVIMDQNLWSNVNQRILKIASEIVLHTGLKLNVRFHPANIISDYTIDCAFSKDKHVGASRFVIGHSSSLLVDYEIAGMSVFRYNAKHEKHRVSNRLVFTDTFELLHLLRNPKSKEKEVGSKEMIAFSGKDAMKRFDENVISINAFE